MQSFSKVECKISPISINNSLNRSQAIDSPFCRKKLDFSVAPSIDSDMISTSNSGMSHHYANHHHHQSLLNDQTLNEKIKKSKKTTAIVAGTIQTNTNIRNYSKSSQQFPKVPSNTKRNARERKRVRTINDYFSQLQKYLPHSSANKQTSNNNTSSSNNNKNAFPQMPVINTTKKLSKVETLKAAIEYIEYLQVLFCFII